MWPWEHVAVAYMLYSLSARVFGRRPPSPATAGAIAAAALVPDLVDKPLSWGLDVFPTGYAVGHSVLVAAPAGLAALAVARRRGRSALGAGAVVGYWSHLAADVLAPVRSGNGPDVGRVLWPVVAREPYGREYGLGRGLVYVREFVVDLRAESPETLLVYLSVPAVALAVWVADGAPGAGWLRSALVDLAGRSSPDRG